MTPDLRMVTNYAEPDPEPRRPLRSYWMSWWASGPFELSTPWWVSGSRFYDGRDQDSIVAAVRAPSMIDARLLVLGSHTSHLSSLVWRFVEERPEGWEPFTERFPRADWMEW